jgi:2-methylcitrate dehydratase PrpD
LLFELGNCIFGKIRLWIARALKIEDRSTDHVTLLLPIAAAAAAASAATLWEMQETLPFLMEYKSDGLSSLRHFSFSTTSDKRLRV